MHRWRGAGQPLAKGWNAAQICGKVIRTRKPAAAMSMLSPPAPRLTIRNLRAVGVLVPMSYALGTSRGAITTAPLLLIDLETEEGITGRSYLFCYLPAAAPAIAALLGEVLEITRGQSGRHRSICGTG